MNKYLAKSNPKETIQEHTDNLLKNYRVLKETYPSLEINWDMLYKACLYHDFGKMNSKFQEKIETHRLIPGEIPHGILSLAFIDYEDLEANGYTEEDIRVLFHSIAYHHERELDYTDEELENEIEALVNEFEGFHYNKISKRYVPDYIEETFYFKNDRIYEERDSDIFFNYIMIKGLLNRIDYSASGYIEIENKNDFLSRSLDRLMNEWKEKVPNCKWNDLQEYMIKNKDKNVVVVAQTGMGKTEAGLLWIGDNKGFFTLPLKTAINSIYDRVVELIKENKEDRVGLLHSDTFSQYIINASENIDVSDYYNRTKQMSLPLTICTLDQIFDFVYKYRGFEPKIATLAYSKVVIDEIQMYSPDLLAYLIIGLSYINKVGGKFAILTATLPKFIINLLEEEGIEFELSEKAFINKDLNNRHSLKVIDEEIDIDKIVELYKNNKVLVICNTVHMAQEVYSELMNRNVERVNLLHSRFIKKHRKEKEDKILSLGSYENKDYGIWISTQVVEASLDIDFDILITELSDVNGLFQRLGRCYRKRNFNTEGYNCYVYTGGNKKCSGVGYVIDEEIYQLSKEEILRVDGPLNEEMKVQIINNLYTFERLKDTKYLSQVRDAIKFVKSIKEYDTTKNEVKKIFRNIDSVTVIPKQIYEENYIEIDKNISIISKEYSKEISIEERKNIALEKALARNKLMDYTVSVRTSYNEGNVDKVLEINKYESIPVLNCDYSEDLGVQKIKVQKPENNYEFL
ncbi:CRISPR-associated helicase Cas3' [Clostridium paridis]|uniref:CRISPR-associated helicase Cas3 n=1 Tax=Clostridium paridis TaxID=2803863 RepID=A0A937FEJ9_9CLOT|nr:CRISPR-associated helicase Cas3' [Clostridium paridis]MBL4931894.1 CRISPR-associated helicase Cas3' [Clostridium paridis]